MQSCVLQHVVHKAQGALGWLFQMLVPAQQPDLFAACKHRRCLTALAISGLGSRTAAPARCRLGSTSQQQQRILPCYKPLK